MLSQHSDWINFLSECIFFAKLGYAIFIFLTAENSRFLCTISILDFETTLYEVSLADG